MNSHLSAGSILDLATSKKWTGKILYAKSSPYLLTMNQNLKARVFAMLEPGNGNSRYFDPFIMGLILLNVAAVVLETVDWIYAAYLPLFQAFEIFSVAVFTVEYLLRIWSCTEDPRYKDPLWGRLRFLIMPLALVDLLAILPFYLPFAFDLRFLRAMRLFRLFRILKLARYSDSMQTFADVLRLKKEELLLMFFAIMILLVISSSLMYEAEHDAQPEAFASIPAAMWWGIVTLTTVGYGDIYPVTDWGRFIGSVVVILGIGLFALPTGVLASGFAEVLAKSKEEQKRRKIRCPHCGQYIGELTGNSGTDDGKAEKK